MFNNLNRRNSNSSSNSGGNLSNCSLESRLSPRVKAGVELSILKRNSPPVSDVKSVTLNYLRTRAGTPSILSSTPIPTDNDSDTNGNLRSDKHQRQMIMSDSSSPAKSPDEVGSKSWSEWQNQKQAYVQWVNSQLKKKPGARQIEDLKNDMKDGVALIELIDIVSGEKLPGANMCPSTYGEMRENIELVIQYMSANRIRMHHTTAKDIADGKQKSIMRLILALAAHFKPHCVKHSTNPVKSTKSGSHMTGIAQGASAALTEARRHAAKAGNSFRRSRPPVNYAERRKTYHAGSSSDQFSDSDQSFGERVKVFPGRDEGDGASADKSPNSSTTYSPSTTSQQHPAARGVNISKSSSADYIAAKDSGTELEDSAGTLVDGSQYEEIFQEYKEVYDDMKDTKQDLLKLQDLLLCGEPPDGEESEIEIGGSSPAEEIVILKSRLIQSTEMQNDLREELSHTKNECMSLQGAKAGLVQRLADQDETISQLKQEILRRDFDEQNFESEKNELRKAIQEKEKLVLDLRKNVARRDQRIDQLQNELQLQIQEKESVTKALKMQISELHDRLRIVGETGASLKARVASQDKRMAQLEGKIIHSSSDRDSSVSSQGSVDDLQVVRDSIHSLRLSFKGGDPQQHTIDTLEQSVSTLLEKLQLQNHSSSSNGSSQSPYGNNVSRRLNFDSTGDVRRSPITAIPGSTSFSYNQLDGPPTSGSPMKSQTSTKVLYFTDKALNPSMCNIQKRLGEITLKDFKKIHDKPGNYRYSFKALDPEFGTVKEEIMNDDDIIPGWEGKIVAWIEEDT